MFTVTDSATSSGIKSKSLFSSGKADDFWIVASFVIPKDLGEEDWWLASIHDDKGVIQDRDRHMGNYFYGSIFSRSKSDRSYFRPIR
jgi:hypothetical protein